MELTLRNQLNGRGLYWLSQLCLTCKLDIVGNEYYESLAQSSRGILWSSWHGQAMLVMTYMRQLRRNGQIRSDQPMTVMIPDDWRGQSLAVWLKKLGIRPRPMELEEKGMGTAQRFLSLTREIQREAAMNFLAPDGPEGPSMVVKPGLGFLAQRTGLPILPVAGYNRHGYALNRWDAYHLPLPFTRIQIVVGQPLYVSKGENTAEVNERIRRALNDVHMAAQAHYYAGQGH